MSGKMKDSGIEWIGEIPENWDVVRLRFLGELQGGGLDKIYRSNDIPVRMVNYVDVYNNKNLSLGANIDYMKITVPRSKLISHKLQKGDIILTPSSETVEDIGLASVVSDDISDLYYSYHVLRLRPAKGVSPRFLTYAFVSNYLRNYFTKISSGSIRKTVDRAGFLNAPIIIPKTREQKKVSDFLDKKTSEIESIKREIEKEIEVLEDYKKSLIFEAVTKGLDKNAEMKDSGVEWIGEMPKEWTVSRITGVSKPIRGNSAFKKDELLEKGKYVALQYGRTYKVDEIDKSYDAYVNEEFFKFSQVINFGYTILISTSETMEDLGHSVYYARHDMGLLGGEQIALKPLEDFIIPKYLYYCTKAISDELKQFASGIKVFRYNINDLKNIKIAYPTISQQQKIVEDLDHKTSKINSIISDKREQLEVLDEYKKSLIYEYVTGKKEVK